MFIFGDWWNCVRKSPKSDNDLYDHMSDIELPEDIFDSFTPEEQMTLESGGEIFLVLDSGKKYLKTRYFRNFKILEISKWKNGVDQNEQSNVDHFTGNLFECVLFIYVPSDWINKLDAIQPRTLEPCNMHVLVYALLREVINILIWRSSFQTDSYPYQMA